MTRINLLCILSLLMFLSSVSVSQTKEQTPVARKSIYDFTMKTIDGKDKSLVDYKGDVVLVVNVASECGYTPQYKDLEEVFEKYKSKGFRILAFPANNFGGQEPGTDSEIKSFCESKYNVTFDMFSKISVKGDDQHALYQYITKESQFPGDVKWNFQKYLVDRQGNIVAMFPSRVKPTDKSFIEKLEFLLSQGA
ncbi:MAG TPA: glutathione peroxidase [Bacteroidota bacterium]|nr:glutathione peroxidase [Bacteroidota bacterium]